jgi:predicted PurR-regulated permease PerM
MPLSTEALAQEILELKLEILSASDQQAERMARVRSQVRWLIIALLVTIFGGGGLFAFLTWQQHRQITTLQQDWQVLVASRQDLATLQDELDELQTSLPTDLAANWNELQTQTADLATQLDTLETAQSTQAETLSQLTTSISNRQQAIAALTQALTTLVDPPAPETPAPPTDEES